MSAAAAAPIDTASKLYWGPRLWKMLHMLAEISDRRDMIHLWNNLMSMTAHVMPCEQCRAHLGGFMKTHNFVKFAKPHLVTGEMLKLKVRTELFNLHNEVNARLGKPIFAADHSATSISRDLAFAEVGRLYEEIRAAWDPLIHSRIHGPSYTNWKKHLNMMIALASGGPS